MSGAYGGADDRLERYVFTQSQIDQYLAESPAKSLGKAWSRALSPDGLTPGDRVRIAQKKQQADERERQRLQAMDERRRMEEEQQRRMMAEQDDAMRMQQQQQLMQQQQQQVLVQQQQQTYQAKRKPASKDNTLATFMWTTVLFVAVGLGARALLAPKKSKRRAYATYSAPAAETAGEYYYSPAASAAARKKKTQTLIQRVAERIASS